MVIHLHTNSYYSFLRGTSSPLDLVNAANHFGMPAVALTDYHSLTGAVEFYDHCKDQGIQPILGLEFHCTSSDTNTTGTRRSHRLVMLAMNLTGWAGLCRLASLSEEKADLNGLAGNTDGLICLESSLIEAMPAEREIDRIADHYLNHIKTLFPERLYLAVHRNQTVDTSAGLKLANLARKHKLPLVATHPARMLHATDERILKLLTAIRMNIPIKHLSDEADFSAEAYFISAKQFISKFQHLPGAIAAHQEIADRCKFDLPVRQHHFPELDLPPGYTANEILRLRAYQGAKQLYTPFTQQIQSRLEHELAIIEQLGYASIFLIMSEIIEYAREIGVPTASRGSASSSVVAHCLGITTPDPISLNLFFERFLNPARATPPDIDTDLCSRRRDEVIRYIYERFGHDKVAMVCTISRFRSRSALREVSKVYGLTPRQINSLANDLPYRRYRPVDSEEPADPFTALSKKYPDSLHQAIFRDAAAIIGLPHHLSIHPGGVVITPGKLTDLVPTALAPKGIVITQFDLDSIEQLGLVKFDMLGIRGLTVLGDVAEAIAQSSDRPAGMPPISLSPIQILDQIPVDDPKTRHTIQTARTIGCFQIESPGMRTTLREIHASTIDDIMVALALYRPGPLTGGLKDSFVRRHLGMEAASQLHPALTPLLEDTYGVILYQEQVLRIAHELAGLSLADADLLRRAMSHFNPGKQMETLKDKFISSCLERHSIPVSVGERIWELMAAFAGYGFPKAHAASYAAVAWRAAWCKTHFPAIFMAAVLANWGGYYSQRVYLSEARRLGLSIRPPHINYAQREFSAAYLDDREILFMGLDQVRDLTKKTINQIITQRPFTSLNDFLIRADPRPIEAENLILSGAMDGFGTIPALLAAIKHDLWRHAQLSLFHYEQKPGTDWDLEQKITAQERVLGIGLAAHPLELYTSQLAGMTLTSTFEAAEHTGSDLQIVGIRQTFRRSTSESGQTIYQMELEDTEGTILVLISSSLYKRYREDLTHSSGPYIVEGTVEIERDTGEHIIRATRIDRIIRRQS